MKKRILFLFFAINYFTNTLDCFSQTITYDVQACIDCSDELHIQGTQMWWVHINCTVPGQHSNCAGVLSVNGSPWGTWSNPYTISGSTSCMDMTYSINSCRSNCNQIQAPTAGNGWESVFLFNDDGVSGSTVINIVFTFTPATPTSTFTVSSPACAGNDVTVSYTGTGTNTATYNWNFDGAAVVSGSGSGPYVINWPTAGNHNVTLDVSDCSTTSPVTTVPVTVAVSPTSLFTVSTPVCEDSISVITYTGSGTSGAVYNWNFNGGTIVSGAGQGPYAVKWAVGGAKNITLDINESGCLSSLVTNSVVVTAPETSSFTASAPVCRGENATITYTGTASSGATYLWNFDGGSVIAGSGQGPYTVSWPAAGTYNITLKVTQTGCSSILTTVQQIVNPSPSSDFSFVDICLNDVINFNDSSTNSGGTITGWIWNFGDASPVNNNQNPAYTYSNEGIYQVSLIALSNNGCKDTIVQSVNVHALPKAKFSAVNVCEGTPVSFTNLSTIAGLDVIQLSGWNFGDGNSDINSNTSHLYAAPGAYSVKLLTVSSAGCLDSITKTLVVNPNPVVNFTANDTIGCQPLCISFQNLTSGLNSQLTWSTSDGGVETDIQTFIHCYTNDSVFSPMDYSPGLTVTSDSGCVSTIIKNNYITVYPNPKAEFSVQPNTALYAEPIITISNLSTGASVWNWNFGDLLTASVSDPESHTYADTGTYTITLIASNQYNCIDTAYQIITIEPDFVFNIPNAFTPDGDGINDTFSGTGIFINKYEMRIFDRWGNMIFFSDTINKPWDGKSKQGKEISLADVYVYSILATDFKGRKHSYKGAVTLIR